MNLSLGEFVNDFEYNARFFVLTSSVTDYTTEFLEGQVVALDISPGRSTPTLLVELEPKAAVEVDAGDNAKVTVLGYSDASVLADVVGAKVKAVGGA